MVFVDEMKLIQSYVICESETVVDDTVYCEYGIIQNSVDDNDHTEVVTIGCISTDKRVVQTLLERMMYDIVDPITLQYVVEDYLDEIYGL